MRCFDCAFAHELRGNLGMMECRRYAPRPNSVRLTTEEFPSEYVQNEPYWPVVHEEDWCGEFQQRQDRTETDEQSRTQPTSANPPTDRNPTRPGTTHAT